MVEYPEKSVMQFMSMQAMNMCKRRTFTEDEIWSVVETLKNRYNS